MDLLLITKIIILLPLVGALIAGLVGKLIGRKATHRAVISLVAISFLLSCYLFYAMIILNHPAFTALIYNWADIGNLHLTVSLLVDKLSAVMTFIVTFISFMVYIYTIGYMADDPGYQRFFCYISLFTFAMLVLVLADNFLLLYFGWEGVGLVSYLLIGFWFKRDTATLGSLKAFLVNRIGDLGFLLGIALILMDFGSLQYQTVFAGVPKLLNAYWIFPGGATMSAITLTCLLLFVGAMGKSAQVPLHVWLPESMEGPTPISALIHAATMVTAGIYMVTRLSPLFEYSPTALSVILVIGATTCFFMGLLAVVQFDIKRVIAYSTLSQLGYMAVALGVSAYDAAIFHLITHAFFKALLFLAAGSVIIALHHEQDMRKMGGLARLLPITYFTFLIGSLALAAIPPFAGFYSKDIIIEATHLSTIPGAGYAYFCVQVSAFVTALYTFRALFLTFHTQARFDLHGEHQVHESPWVVLLPLVVLALPSVVAGALLIEPMLFSSPHLLGSSVFILPQHAVLKELATDYHGVFSMALAAFSGLTFWLVIAGILTAWFFNVAHPQWSEALKKKFAWLYAILLHKYGFDEFNQAVLVKGTRETGSALYTVSDLKLIDGLLVNGSAESVGWFARISRRIQTGYLYHYTLVMILGLMGFLIWYVR
ncbi:MAG TPA: NADH-quinone oxidoreductase subunit L [Gammaproteobacteria bacterium]|nr:NADH-quinone oxidoreductase subunit L [Gammaproteobacteria bacterium]